MRGRSAGVAALVLLVLSLLPGCASEGLGARPKQRTVVRTATSGPDGVQQITVTGDELLRFDVTEIRAKPGLLRITLKNAGGTPHDLEVRPMKANTGIVEKDESKSVEVRLNRGTYRFVCTFHIASNMVGTISVS